MSQWIKDSGTWKQTAGNASGVSSQVAYGTTAQFEVYKQRTDIPVGTEYIVTDDYDEKIGNLNNLQTTSKTNIVSAINEVNQKASAGDVYSETETVIGTFLGKPLYRKAYRIGQNITSSAYTSMTIFTDYASISRISRCFAVSTSYSDYSDCWIKMGSQTSVMAKSTVRGDSENPVLVFVEYTKVGD